MTPTQKAAMEMALVALADTDTKPGCVQYGKEAAAMQALRAALAEQADDSYEALWNAFHRIETAAVTLPTFEVRHEGGLEACTRNIVEAIVKQADDKADMTIKLPAHHIPIGLLGADVRYRYIAHQYAEAYAIEAVRLNMAPLSDEEIVKAVSAERERWQEVAQDVIKSHDAALAYVYESLKAQGVGSITIPDAAVAEIRAVNALRELVQPNAGGNAT